MKVHAITQKYNKEEVRLLFKGYLLGKYPEETLTTVSKELGMDASMLSRILSGERDVPQALVLDILKLNKVSYYVAL